jgi:ABC-type Zn uptake system ZnuABC Zn-binding protein ZnuA
LRIRHWQRRGLAVTRIASLVLLTAACAPQPDGRVLSGTAHIKNIVADLTGESKELRALIPAGMCPGHYDMAPADIAAVSNCQALLLQPWQVDLPNVREVIEASKIGEDRTHIIDVPGNWMVPELQIQGTRAVAAKLAELGYADTQALKVAADERVREVEAAAEELRARFQEDLHPAEKAVLVNTMQRPLAEWLGFRIAGAFGRGEDMSAQEVKRWVRTAQEENVALVIENLQSGDAQTSRAIARDAGAPHVVLTNFPGGFTEGASYLDALRANVKRIEEALRGAERAN